jgi:hypothetical protein
MVAMLRASLLLIGNRKKKPRARDNRGFEFIPHS